MQVVEKLTHVAHTFLLRTKLTVNEQSDLLYALIPKLVIRIISQRYVFLILYHGNVTHYILKLTKLSTHLPWTS